MSKNLRQLALAAIAVTASFMIGCQYGMNHPPAATGPASTAPATGISAADLRDILAGFAKAHADKIRLSTWAGTPFLPVGPAFKPFYQNMSKQNKELAAELKEWANGNKVDLTFHYTDDVDGKAQKMMEDRQEKLIRADDQQNFERDMLMQMYTDYEWNLCQVMMLLPAVRDAKLKAYLEKSRTMYENGSGEIQALLKRYKFGG